MAVARSLAQTYRRFGEVDAARSPLYARVAVALSESEAAMRAITAVPARKRQPALVLAALHELALAGHAPALAAAYATADADAAATAAVDTLRHLTDAMVAIALRRPSPVDQSSRAAVLHPALAEAARRTGAQRIGLVDVGRSAGFNLSVDRVGITYAVGSSVGDPDSVVQLTASVVGEQPVPIRPLPQVVARVGLDRHPLDVTDPADARWLRAGVPPDQPERAARLAAELALAASQPPLMLRGDPVDRLLDAIAVVPDGALPVVITTWALSRCPVEACGRFLRGLEDAARGRTVAWVSVEGVGVAPTIPTLGDRPASGHSIIGLGLGDRSGLRVAVLGRCWSRGRVLAWLADP